MNEVNERIVPLDEMDDYEVAEGDPDVRGWHVFSSDGQRIGEVDELLIDTEALKVRYLDVDLDDDLQADGAGDRHILIPIGYARLAEKDDHILIDGHSGGSLSGMPSYSQEPLTRDYESAVLERFSSDRSLASSATTPEPGDVYDDSRFYGPRRKKLAGG